MKNVNPARLRIQVLGFDRPLSGHASVTIEIPGDGRSARKPAAKVVYDKTLDAFVAADLPAGDYVVTASADGYEAQERLVTVASGGSEELFILGRKGQPAYYRGRVRVPFEPLPDLLGVVARPDPKSQTDADPRIREVATKLGLVESKAHPNLLKNRLHLYQYPAGASDSQKAEIQKALTANEAVALCAPVLKLPDKNATLLTSDLIVKFQPHVTTERVAGYAREFGVTLVRHIPYAGNAWQFRTREPISLKLLDLCERFLRTGEVIYAEPDLWHTIESDNITPPNALFPAQWDHPIIHTPAAWQTLHDIDANKTFGSPNVIVAVFDTGVDALHPSFSGMLTDGSAKIYQLFDFVNMVANNNDLSSGGHGTCCAGASVGKETPTVGTPVSEQNTGTVGIAGNCKLVGVRRGGAESTFSDAYIWVAGFNPNSALPGFPAPISPGVDIISNSFGASIGSPISGLMSDTFDYLTSYGRNGKGVALFFSTGNNLPKTLFTPTLRPWASYKKCNAVGASTLQNDSVTEIAAPYSNFGNAMDPFGSGNVEFCAPSHSDYQSGAGTTVGIQHAPPNHWGAWSAARRTKGNVPGRANISTTLQSAAAVGAGTVTVASAAGFAVPGQAILIEAPGAVGSEAHTITAVNAATKVLTLGSADIDGNSETAFAPLNYAHAAGHAVIGSTADYTNCMGGTSYATPVCAGVAALILSVNPDLTWVDVRQIMRNTAVKIDPTQANAVGRWVDAFGTPFGSPGYAGPFYSRWYGYGRVDAAAAVTAAQALPFASDIVVRDNLADNGTVPSSGAFWATPDAWVRNASPAVDGAAALPANYASAPPHQNPVRGQDNWVYVRIKNIGTAASGNFYVRVYVAHYPGAEFLFPDNFIPTNHPGNPPSLPAQLVPGTYLIGESAVATLANGPESILNIQWSANLIPPDTVMVNGSPVHWHPCLLVQIAPFDGPTDGGDHVWDSNNLAQRNLTIVDADAGLSDIGTAIVVGNRLSRRKLLEVEIDRGKLPKATQLYVEVLDERAFAWLTKQQSKDYKIGNRRDRRVLLLAAQQKVRIPVLVAYARLVPLVIGVVPVKTARKSRYEIVVNQYDDPKRPSGSYGISVSF